MTFGERGSKNRTKRIKKLISLFTYVSLGIRDTERLEEFKSRGKAGDTTMERPFQLPEYAGEFGQTPDDLSD